MNRGTKHQQAVRKAKLLEDKFLFESCLYDQVSSNKKRKVNTPFLRHVPVALPMAVPVASPMAVPVASPMASPMALPMAVAVPVALDCIDMFPPVKTAIDVVGQVPGMAKMHTFMRQFDTRRQNIQYPVAVLHGRPGIGKTASVFALAADYGFRVLEVNASEMRTYADMSDFLLRAGFGKAQEGLRSLILLEEMDGAHTSAENSITSLIEHIERFSSKVEDQAPIIATCNDARKLSALKKVALNVQFHRLFGNDMCKLMKKVCRMHRIPVSTSKQTEYIALAAGDVRQMVNLLYLHQLSTGGVSSSKDVGLGGTLFDSVRAVMNKSMPTDPSHVDRLSNFYAAGILASNVDSDNDLAFVDNMSSLELCMSESYRQDSVDLCATHLDLIGKNVAVERNAGMLAEAHPSYSMMKRNYIDPFAARFYNLK